MTEGNTSPLTSGQLVDEYFVEHRTKLLDVAAFLDRLDRAGGSPDFRVQSLRDAVRFLQEEQPGRVARMLEHFSDPTAVPMEALDQKGAFGAFDRARLGRD
ncbi:MAG TPA: hypothetical protein VNT60_08390 [Deinococcales bacterium]|nr:hypothetical protein [Deinococcales bacterium]